jgi:hypothetical protein
LLSPYLNDLYSITNYFKFVKPKTTFNP